MKHCKCPCHKCESRSTFCRLECEKAEYTEWLSFMEWKRSEEAKRIKQRIDHYEVTTRYKRKHKYKEMFKNG